MIILGKAPVISLAKRYITGEVNKLEFEKILKDLVPQDLFTEKENIKINIDKINKEISEFREKCKNKIDNHCQHCGKKKSLFGPLSNECGFLLCKNCKTKLLDSLRFKGFLGKYFVVDPQGFTLADFDKGIKLNIKIKEEYL